MKKPKLLLSLAVLTASAATAQVEYVDPTIGNIGWLFFSPQKLTESSSCIDVNS